MFIVAKGDGLGDPAQQIGGVLFLVALFAPLMALPAAFFAWLGLFQPEGTSLRPARVLQLVLVQPVLAAAVVARFFMGMVLA